MNVPPNNPYHRRQSPFDETLKMVSYCPLCENKYNLMEALILEEKDSASLLYIRCRFCRSAILALIMHNQMGVSSVGLVTDLSADEVLQFRHGPAVTDDDVLSLYQTLQKTNTVLELVGSS